VIETGPLRTAAETIRLRLHRCLAGLPVSKAVLVVLFVAVGLYLRLDSLSSQILLDDEWHSIAFARHHTLGWLWTNYAGSGATAIPMTIYQRAVLCLFGWNEAPIRLPNLACGLVMVVALPWVLRRVANLNVVLWFLFFLAVSPFLVFYSRNSRPYAIFVLLSFLAILHAYLWLRGGAKGALVVFVVTSALAVYVHLFAVTTVAACFIGCLAALVRNRFSRWRAAALGSGWHDLIIAAVCTLLMIALLYGLPWRNGMSSKLPVGPGIPLSQFPWLGSYEYLCGTASPLWLFGLGALALTGIGVLVVGEGAGFLGLLAGVAVANVAAVVASHPECVDVPVVFARYCIVLFPIFYLLCAVGGEWLRSRIFKFVQRPLSRVPVFAGLALVGAAYFLATPNWTMLALKPNNFAMHSAFLESYRSTDWERPYRSQFCQEFGITKKNVPDFYLRLASDDAVRAIVEYPMPIEDHYNIHYYYQHFHGKRIYVGYVLGEPHYPTLAGQACPPMEPIGDLLLDADGRQQDVHFTNLIDIKNPAAIQRTGASYFVVHKNYFAEIRGVKAVAIEPQAQAVATYLRGMFGEPRHEDSRLWVFGIGGAGR
jgi:hypothetical protein